MRFAAGYSHPNESFWPLIGKAICIMLQAIVASRAVFEQFMTSFDRFTPPREKPALAMLQAAAEALIELLPAHVPKLQTIHREQLSNLARGSLRNVVS
jgi:hypothetical protein